jgi:hypothetical protein
MNFVPTILFSYNYIWMFVRVSEGNAACTEDWIRICFQKIHWYKVEYSCMPYLYNASVVNAGGRLWNSSVLNGDVADEACIDYMDSLSGPALLCFGVMYWLWQWLYIGSKHYVMLDSSKSPHVDFAASSVRYDITFVWWSTLQSSTADVSLHQRPHPNRHFLATRSMLVTCELILGSN